MEQDDFVKYCLEKRSKETKKLWYLSNFIASGLQGSVFRVCSDSKYENCTNILKIVDNDDFDKETRNQIKCSNVLSFVLPLTDNWLCGDNGIIITTYLPIKFEEFILSNESIGKKICVIYKIILYIYEMHTKCSIFHLDLHLKNIMMDIHYKPYFIDFGSSVDISNIEDVKIFKRLQRMNPNGNFSGYDYIKIAKIDYGKFIFYIDRFIKESFNIKEYSFLEKFLSLTNDIVEYFTTELKNSKESLIDDAKNFEKDVIDVYKQGIEYIFLY